MRLRCLLLATAGLLLTSAAPAPAAPPCVDRPVLKVLVEGRGILESVKVDRRGRLFFTDAGSGELLMLRRPGAAPRAVVTGIDSPGGIVFRRDGDVLVGFGTSIAGGLIGNLLPAAGLLRVDPDAGEARIHVEGLQQANGIARGPGRTIYASNDIVGGVDRVQSGRVTLNWARVLSANGLVVDRSRRHLFAAQTFTAAAIARVPLDAPAAARTWFAAAPLDIAAGFDGLTRDGHDRLYVAANSAGQVWRVDGPGAACVLAERDPFPSGPSDAAFGRRRGHFPPRNLYVTTFGGELLELVGARAPTRSAEPHARRGEAVELRGAERRGGS